MELGPISRAMTRNVGRFALVAVEVALTLAIVVNCVGLILEARKELALESGFVEEELAFVIATNFSPDYQDEGFVETVNRQDLAALRAMPGVVAATPTGFLPWAGGGSSNDFYVEGREMEPVMTQTYDADPEIWDTLGVEILRGRSFTQADVEAENELETVPVVISEGLAELVFGQENPLGEVLRFSPEGKQYPVVGVFGPFFNPYGWPIDEYAVIGPGANRGASFSTFLVRAEPGRLDQVLADVETTLLGVDDGRNFVIRPVPEVRAMFQANDRILVHGLHGLLGFLILVTGLGIVGVTAFSVADRRRQIGVRRALGARRRDILRYFLLESWLVTSSGLVVGVGLAYLLNLGLDRFTEIPRLAPPVLLAAVAAFWVIGVASALGPALRASRVPPAVATRNV